MRLGWERRWPRGERRRVQEGELLRLGEGGGVWH
jgi:hypothetical protein